MKAKIYDLSGNVKSEIKLPKVFSTKHRPDVIKKAVVAVQSKKRQAYGANKLAGMRSSAHYHGKRDYRYTMMNREMARISRIHGRVGYMAFRARVVPQAVKGRKAHPPKPEKKWALKINAKEKLFAIKSAVAATANLKLVLKRGHKTDISPIVFINEFEGIEKTKDISALLNKIVKDEMKRCRIKKVRAGKGKMRGRRYKKKKGPLVILSKDCKAAKAVKNIPGVDVMFAGDFDIEKLAPGSQAGRLVIATESALNEIGKVLGE